MKMCAAVPETLSFEQQNKRFANHCEYSNYPLPAFTRAFNFLVKF